jgi:ankyrin repeat protein
MIRLLLERGADPNKPTTFGTPLTQAAWHNSIEATQLLLDRGARVEGRDRFADYTPLHWAASTDAPRPQLVKLLLAKGADPNAAGGDPVDAFLGVPQTPLMLAQKRGHTAIVEALQAAGAKASGAAEALAQPVRALPDTLNGTMLAESVERAVTALQVTAASSTCPWPPWVTPENARSNWIRRQRGNKSKACFGMTLATSKK